MFKALLITQTDDPVDRCALTELDETQLPASGDVTVRVDWSTVNYKDGLAITGRSPVVRSFPMVPGIDFAGTVTDSAHPRWKPGDRVILNGFDVGETHWGGLAQRARVKGDWLVALPDGLSAREAMAIGTAGYTAMLCVMALRQHWAEAGVPAGSGEVLVTGANGGVGSVANALLAACGLAQGMDLPASVAPFILRGVTLYGIDSVMAPLTRREAAWAELARGLDRGKLAALTMEIGLADAIAAGSLILDGQVRGRLVVNVNG